MRYVHKQRDLNPDAELRSLHPAASALAEALAAWASHRREGGPSRVVRRDFQELGAEN